MIMDSIEKQNDKLQYHQALINIAKGGAILFVGGSITRIIGFLRQFITIRMLSPYEYGMIMLGLTCLTIGSYLSYLGMEQGAQRYIAYHHARNELSDVRGAIFSSARIVGVVASLITIITISLSGPLSSLFSKPDLKEIIVMYGIMIPFSVGTGMIVAYLLGFGRPDVVVRIKDIYFGIFSVTFLYIALLVDRNMYSALVSLTISYILLFIISLRAYKKYISRQLKEEVPKKLGKPLVLFSLPLYFTVITSLIMGNIDTLMIGYFMPAENVGYYNAAFLLMQLIPIFLNPLGIIFMPIATSLIAKGDDRHIKDLYRVVTKWLFIFTLPLFLTFFLFSSSVLNVFFGKPYSLASVALMVLCASEFIHTFLGPNNHALIAYGKTKVLMISSITATLVNILLNTILIPRMGINGAAIATGISLAISNLIDSTYLYIKYRVHPFGREYLIPVVFLLASSACLYFPLSKLVSLSGWFSLLCYPALLLIGILLVFITRSYS